MLLYAHEELCRTAGDFRTDPFIAVMDGAALFDALLPRRQIFRRKNCGKYRSSLHSGAFLCYDIFR